MWHRETVQVLTAGTVHDSRSDEDVADWSTATERSVLALVEPRPSQEPVQDARNSISSGFTLYLSASDPVTRLNRVRVRGDVYPVQGAPADWAGAGVVVQAFGTTG